MIEADCWRCAYEESARLKRSPDYSFAAANSFMQYRCPECGNKRCPKASNHEFTCTGSNEPGQEGSVYS